MSFAPSTRRPALLPPQHVPISWAQRQKAGSRCLVLTVLVLTFWGSPNRPWAESPTFENPPVFNLRTACEQTIPQVAPSPLCPSLAGYLWESRLTSLSPDSSSK